MSAQSIRYYAVIAVVTLGMIAGGCARGETAVAMQSVVPIQPKPAKHDPVKPLPRIAARPVPGRAGEFYVKATGRRFVPDGFNRVVLGNGGKGWHATFNTDVYDPVAMEASLAAMEALGANAIRVWAWGEPRNGGGFCGKPEDRGLNGAYMENFVDFLRRCTAHGIYVVPILDQVPHNSYYDYLIRAGDARKPDESVTLFNRQFLARGLIEAKRAAVRDFVAYVKASDAGLLNTILGWELQNEACIIGFDGPFSQTTGIATTANGKRYDMSSKDSRQACWDDGVVYWANELSKAIKSVDRQAMVTVGMWTSDAQGREPVNGIDVTSGSTKDLRFCPQPSAIARPDCRLDFLDIHIYPWGGSDKISLKTHEWEAVSKSGKPVLVGEYGAFSSRASVDEGKKQVMSIRDQLFKLGYAGALYWSWDKIGTGTFNALENGFGEMLSRDIQSRR